MEEVEREDARQDEDEDEDDDDDDGVHASVLCSTLRVRVINFPSRLDSADKLMLIELNGLEINLFPRGKVSLENLTR